MKPTFATNTASNTDIADQYEKNLVIQSLNKLIKDRTSTVAVADVVVSGISDTPLLELKDRFIPRVTGSAFDEVCDPARTALQKMVASPAFARLLKQEALPADVQICVDEKACLFALVATTQVQLFIEFEPTLAEELAMLGEFAGITGGHIYSGDNFSVEQWLRFEDFILPTTVADIHNLIAYLSFKLPESPALGDFQELLDAHEDSPFHLSDNVRQIIKDVTLEITQGQTSLLQKLAFLNFNLIPASEKREHSEKFLTSCLRSKTAKALGRAIHERLEWHLDLDDAQLGDEQLMHMAAVALALDLGASDQPVIAGYDVYRPANAPLNAAQVREELEAHLVTHALIEENVAPLAAHLLLAKVAPEFLVQGAPLDLTLDKPGWVLIAQTVAMLEHVAPGTSRVMNYAQIKAFSDLAPVTYEQNELQEITGVIPVINWAVLNGVIVYQVGRDYGSASLTKASSYFNRYMDALRQSETGLLAAPPDRRKLGLQSLKKVMPEGDYLEHKSLQFTFNGSRTETNFLDALRYSSPTGVLADLYNLAANAADLNEYSLSELLRLRLSVLDLYLSGDLVEEGRLTSRFKLKSGFQPPANAFARLAELENADTLYDQAFDTYYTGVQEGLAAVIKMAICCLPKDDRDALMNGYISLYTVRTSTLRKITGNLLNLEAEKETQLQRDAEKGRYGLLLCRQYNGETRCYEMFTMRGLCRERPDLANKLQSSEVINGFPTKAYVGSKHDLQLRIEAQDWPLDFAAYRDGSEPRNGQSSSVVVEKLWHFHTSTENLHPVSLFFSPSLEKLTKSIMSSHPVATRDELYAAFKPQTDLEHMRIRRDLTQTNFANVAVPFFKCVNDIRSGEEHRVREGIGGCIVDGLSVLGLVVGLSVASAKVIAATASNTLRVLGVAKATVRAALAFINPIDGLPKLARKGYRLAHRNLVLLGENSASTVESVARQLKKLTGHTDARYLVKALQRSDLQHGSWRAAENAGDVVDLAVIKRHQSIHVFHKSVGGAWGPALKNVQLLPYRVHRLFGKLKPTAYTRHYVGKALAPAKSRLDTAIKLLESADDNTRLVVKYMLGEGSDDAIRYLLKSLRTMRSELDAISVANMSFRHVGPNALAAISTHDYKKLKAAKKSGLLVSDSMKRFIKIYPKHLDAYYKKEKYAVSKIADVLIHEMSHGSSGTLDLFYAKEGDKLTDVAVLVDLARKPDMVHPALSHLHRTYEATELAQLNNFDAVRHSLAKIIQDNPALYNANSIEVAVSLLNQRTTDPAKFASNITLVQKTVDEYNPSAFISKLEIDLSV
ncbi:hypothetical protein [Pseudomonas sp. MPR-ANC1]|uniref:hypothetical protein n=1 Tax=Pseudomonas sp. MPR-ANC1 TaxID=2075548 RepID=UPI0011AF4F4B|nr:hypothetical protein [Pseudomonas sp. MPR-ANC1]